MPSEVDYSDLLETIEGVLEDLSLSKGVRVSSLLDILRVKAESEQEDSGEEDEE